jgi:hypothetical protein
MITMIHAIAEGRQGMFLFLPQWLALRFMPGLKSPALSSLASCRPTTRTDGRATSFPRRPSFSHNSCIPNTVASLFLAHDAGLWFHLVLSFRVASPNLGEGESHCVEERGWLHDRPLLQPLKTGRPGGVPEGTSTPPSG